MVTILLRNLDRTTYGRLHQLKAEKGLKINEVIKLLADKYFDERFC